MHLRWATVVALLAMPALAQDAPPSVSVLLMLKLVTYDQALSSRGTGDFVVAIPFEKSQTRALDEVLLAAKALPQTKIASRALRFVTVSDPGDDAKLAKALDAEQPSALLVLPGSSRTAAYTRLAREKKLYTLAVSAADAELFALFGVTTRDGKPLPVVNLAAARDLGVQLPSSVLKISKTVQ